MWNKKYEEEKRLVLKWNILVCVCDTKVVLSRKDINNMILEIFESKTASNQSHSVFNSTSATKISSYEVSGIYFVIN